MINAGYRGVRHGALAVIERPSGRDEINRRLKVMHEKLFVELQRREGDFGGTYDVWCVCLDTGAQGIAVVYEWRDPDGNPIPYLAERLVSELERRYQRGPVEMREIVAANKRLVEARQAEHDEEMERLVDDHYPLANDLFSSCFHRGVGLRRARDRGRARGEKR